MIVGVEIGGPTKHTLRKLHEMPDNGRRAIMDTFRFMGVKLKKKISADIKNKNNKTGRTYIVRNRRGRRVAHRASAPFETHADLTGTLRRALSWKTRGTNSLLIGYGVAGRPSPEYARIEFGIGDIDPRPSILNTLFFEDVSFETFHNHRLMQLDR